MNLESISEKVEDQWNLLKKKGANHEKFLSRLEQIPNIEIGIFGGAVRDWLLDKEPKDIDIVIKGTPESYKEYDKFLQIYHFDKNKFDGNVIRVGSTLFDIWKLEDTYAIKNGQFNADWFDLTRSVPFNIDSVVSILYNKTITFEFISGVKYKSIDFLNKKRYDKSIIAEKEAAEFSVRIDLSYRFLSRH
jgi:hypothetical protein